MREVSAVGPIRREGATAEEPAVEPTGGEGAMAEKPAVPTGEERATAGKKDGGVVEASTVGAPPT